MKKAESIWWYTNCPYCLARNSDVELKDNRLVQHCVSCRRYYFIPAKLIRVLIGKLRIDLNTLKAERKKKGSGL